MIIDISIKTDVIAKTIHRIGTTPRPPFPIEMPFGLPLKLNFVELFQKSFSIPNTEYFKLVQFLKGLDVEATYGDHW